MQEDCIVVRFSMATAPKFNIGDYIDDEVFGRFYITKEQMPKYNTSTGGYDYELTLEAPYRGWNNWLLCLVAEGRRMESTWTLTDRLQTHANQVLANLEVLGITGYSVSVTAENASEAHCITYSGKHIIDAMTMIADAWGCEWWVDEAGKVIHFGKCEASDTALEFALGDNVESMDIANNRNTYATRLYAYGGTQNIPETYDRKLLFNYTKADSAKYGDVNRPINAAMLEGRATTLIAFNEAVINSNTASIGSAGFGVGSNGLLKGGFRIVATSNLRGQQFTFTAIIRQTGTTWKTIVSEVITASGNEYQASATFDVSSLDSPAIASGSYDIQISVTITNTSANVTQFYVESDLEVSYSVANKYKRILSVVNGASYAITFQQETDPNDVLLFTFDNGAPTGWDTTTPNGIQYTIDGLVGVPLSYYTPEYDAGVLSKIGERRLHLPLTSYPSRCIPATDITAPREEVELVVVWNDIYPKMTLKVGSVEVATRSDTVEHDDGTITKQEWTQYTVTATDESNHAFTFSTKYMLNDKLQVNFTAPTSITPSEGFRLGGMAFDVSFDETTQKYTLIRNETYGLQLPNAELRPSVGDTFFLTGWNPNYIIDLGLVAAAESELATKALAYKAAIEEGNYTFTCHMMSGWPFALEGDTPLYTSDDEPVEEAGGSWFFVSNGNQYYKLPIEGAKVKIIHGALPSGYKVSRIIGYELKLDMPWDSPTYTVGETQAYSRLAQMEKDIQKLS